MANQKQLDILKQGVETWNQWRKKHIDIHPDLSGAKLSGADLGEADLSGANLSGANLGEADLSGANLSGANLSRAKLSRADLSGADLSDADLSNADLESADLSGVNLNGANLSGANLSDADLERAYLTEAILGGAILWKANLRDAHLIRASLTEAILWDANFSGADLSDADLSGANSGSIYDGWSLVLEEELRKITEFLPSRPPNELLQMEFSRQFIHQFTAFYPPVAHVDAWSSLLVYVSVPSAQDAIRADASRFKDELGASPHASRALSSSYLVQGTTITVVPECPGVLFNPPSVSFQWFEEWHRAYFRFLGKRDITGSVNKGTIYIYAGPLLVGTVPVSLLFNEQGLLPALNNAISSSTETTEEKYTEIARGIYQQMFVSYSHEDTTIVEACRNVYRALGLTILIDIDTLRSGQIWNKALEGMISTADIFQLFWSKHAAASQDVQQEWEYALACDKGEGFIRPVYWKKPLVSPPSELKIFHFAYLPPETFGSPQGTTKGEKKRKRNNAS